MSWGPGLAYVASMNLPAPYALSQMTATDVPDVIARLPHWYPDIQVGMESPHLQADFYTAETTLADSIVERDVLPLVIRHPSNGVVALTTYERNVLARSITSRLGVLAPEHRGTLALLGPMLLEGLGRAIGAELAYYYATLKTRHQQVIAERREFQLVGIVPGHDRDAIATSEVKRVYEALYAKLLVSSDEVFVPSRSALTARTREVWAALFGTAPTE
jgi:hypothetical protein